MSENLSWSVPLSDSFYASGQVERDLLYVVFLVYPWIALR
jgi:hypothetical protein